MIYKVICGLSTQISLPNNYSNKLYLETRFRIYRMVTHEIDG
jgi:hypothetical protein